MARFLRKLVILILFISITATAARAQVEDRSMETGKVTLRGEAWADNWFALYLEDKLVIEDSVSINTERSFNAEIFSFSASYPMQINFILKDFKENNTGLEYIGSYRQQMGDGGFIAQFTDMATGKVVGVTDENVRCLVIHKAPLNPSCVRERKPVAGVGHCQFAELNEPARWKDANFDDSKWSAATVYSESAVRPKDGYNKIRWNRAAKLIWGADLETDNTLLCRMKINAPMRPTKKTNGPSK